MSFLSPQPSLRVSSATEVALLGWVQARRIHKNILFWDLALTGGRTLQTVITSETGGGTLETFKHLPVESAVRVRGRIQLVTRKHREELHASHVEIVNAATGVIQPALRGDFDVLGQVHADHVLANRHLYLRHPKVAAIMTFRVSAMRAMRRWFDDHGVMEFTAPVLTPVPLYEDRTAISFTLPSDAPDQSPVFLTQCVGYYMEAAVHALGPVYNMGPSFRGERSRSNRHLMEYWHVKAEYPDVDLPGIMVVTEDLVRSTVQTCREEGERVAQLLGTVFACKASEPPFEQIGYREAVAFLQHRGNPIKFGEGISGQGELELSREFKGPFWIVGNPRLIEPFPYVVDPHDSDLTRTADLICPEGFGELLGTAEKIIDLQELDVRMQEKGKSGDVRYAWIRELREHGMIPHAAFGMGLERFIRWLLGVSHVRDTIPFPRVFHRPVRP
ncbi:hypothetical protein HZA85_00010 [Candidatus Uhrbacteria bacterium]|nr:hypothetical protein [Candidatus Uhrbacteria bacterium]